MDISTRQVLKRTLETTQQHVELDNLVDYEEKWADVSVVYKAYNNYDVEEIPVFDPTQAEEKAKEDSPKMRHTHLSFTDSSTEWKEKMNNMIQFYIEHNLWPVSHFFKGPKEDQVSEQIENNNQAENNTQENNTQENNTQETLLNNPQENEEGPNSFGASSGAIQQGEEF